MHDIAVIVPVRQRPQNVAPLIESLATSTDRAQPVFIVDADDRAELEAIEKAGALYVINNDPLRVSFAVKANIGYRATVEPWLLFCGDDVVFHPGWVENSIDRASGCSFISTIDMGNPRVTRGQHAVHPIIERDWIDRHGASWDGPGVVCHEGYRHWYVDDEWTAVAHKAGQFIYAPDARIEHMHPIFNKGTDDATYRLGQSFSMADRDLFIRRMTQYA